jgi:EmrB/QacA subfamily drug resistance transporter
MQRVEEKASLAPKVGLKTWVQFALIAGPFLSMIDSSVVNIALPVIATNFHSSLVDAQWVLSGYLLALGALLPGSAFLSKRFGARRIYFYSVVGFTVASFLCAVSFSLSSLISFRVVQGALGAALVPVAMDILFGSTTIPSKTGETNGFRDGSRVAGQISPMMGIVLFLAPAIGPTLGGFLVGYSGWPSIFLINVPIGILSAVLVRHYSQEIPQRMPDSRLRFDLVGSVILSLGLLLAIYGASEGPQTSWLSPRALPFIATGPYCSQSTLAGHCASKTRR